MIAGADRIGRAVARAVHRGRPAVAAFLTAGFPTWDEFPDLLRRVARRADVVEIGVPFSDPMADGVTVQRASRIALEGGTTLARILGSIAREAARLEAPIVLMSYLNPLLAYGAERLADDGAAAGVAAVIVPDLPLEEQAILVPALRARGVGCIQLVTPATPASRLARLARASDGFVYAVAINGTTGGGLAAPGAAREYLARVVAASDRPVLCGFGVRRPADVLALVPPAQGVVVGSALIEAIERGESPEAFLDGLVGDRSGARGASR